MPEFCQTVKGHYNFYTYFKIHENPPEREFALYIYEPDLGINDETGILLLISGFGENSQSNVFKKMRKEFSNKYNLITVQCDYFGFEYMQAISSEKLNLLYDFGNGSQNNILSLDETTEYFCDMSFLQAMDNIYATIYAINHAIEKAGKINSKKVMIYGNSHGAFLANLCNIYTKNLFTHICDNSSWLYPEYLRTYRQLGMQNNIFHVIYLAKSIIGFGNNIIYPPYLYSKYGNNCIVYTYHGVNDALITYEEKYKKFNDIENIKVIKIDKTNEVFPSLAHGLGADYLKLFDLFYSSINFSKGFDFNFPDKLFFTDDDFKIVLDYSNTLPIIKIEKCTKPSTPPPTKSQIN